MNSIFHRCLSSVLSARWLCACVTVPSVCLPGILQSPTIEVGVISKNKTCVLTGLFHASVLQLTLALRGTSRAIWWQLHSVGHPCTWSVCFTEYVLCVCVELQLRSVILKMTCQPNSPCSGSLLVTFPPSGPRGHHVTELRCQGRPLEHRDCHLPVSGRQATVPGNVVHNKLVINVFVDVCDCAANFFINIFRPIVPKTWGCSMRRTRIYNLCKPQKLRSCVLRLLLQCVICAVHMKDDTWEQCRWMMPDDDMSLLSSLCDMQCNIRFTFCTVCRHPTRHNVLLMFPLSHYPASQGRHHLSLVTFCLGCCRGIRKTGWTLVSNDIKVMSFSGKFMCSGLVSWDLS